MFLLQKYSLHYRTHVPAAEIYSSLQNTCSCCRNIFFTTEHMFLLQKYILHYRTHVPAAEIYSSLQNTCSCCRNIFFTTEHMFLLQKYILHYRTHVLLHQFLLSKCHLPLPQVICSYVLWPLMALLGVAPVDCRRVGELVGIKVFLSTFVAYTRLADLINNRHALVTHLAANGTYGYDGEDIVLHDVNVTLVNGVMQVRDGARIYVRRPPEMHTRI